MKPAALASACTAALAVAGFYLGVLMQGPAPACLVPAAAGAAVGFAAGCLLWHLLGRRDDAPDLGAP